MIDKHLDKSWKRRLNNFSFIIKIVKDLLRAAYYFQSSFNELSILQDVKEFLISLTSF